MENEDTNFIYFVALVTRAHTAIRGTVFMEFSPDAFTPV
jgi:hypothetical protein